MAESERAALRWLLGGLVQAYDGSKPTFIEPLHSAIAGVDAELADWRPAPTEHTIREIVGHAAAVKRRRVRRLRGEPVGSLPSLFREVASDPPVVGTWNEVVADLRRAHEALLAEVTALDDARLGEKLPGDELPLGLVLTAMAGHDAYHAGQIVAIRRLWEAAKQ
jgi:hypothetical protein